MKKTVLEQKILKVKAETKTALETLWSYINQGQKKQILKVQEVKELFERYGVDYGAE